MESTYNTYHSFTENLPKVDAKNIYELINEFYKKTVSVPFFDTELGISDKTWDEFYNNNTILLLTKIICLDIKSLFREKEEVLIFWDLYNQERQHVLVLDKIFKELMAILNIGFNLVEDTPFVEALINELELIIEKTSLHDVEILYEHATEGRKLPNKLRILFKRKEHKKTNCNNIKAIFNDVTTAMLVSLQNIQMRCRSIDLHALIQTKNHPAHIGLLFGFLKSYQKIQVKINNLSKRHLDYYYRNILEQKKMSAIADKVYVFFKLLPKSEHVLVPKNSLLTAGQDNLGEDRYFKLDKDLVLQSTKITVLKKLMFSSNDSILPLSKEDMITDISLENVNLSKQKEKKGSWNLFNIRQTEANIGMGWALASPFFKSSEITDKKFIISFTFEDTTATLFRQNLNKLVSHTSDKQTKEELAYHFFNQTILLKITTSKSWFPIEKYQIDYIPFLDKKTNNISFHFELSNYMPNWTVYKEDVHKCNFITQFPVLDFTLKETSVYYPYSLLKSLKISEIDLEVEVFKHRKPILCNKHGRVDTDAPFPILGVQPLKGNSFYLGLDEWQYRPLIKLDCIIEWYDIFQPNLATYYKGYSNKEIKDENFLLSFEGDKILSLFSLSEENRILPKTCWENLKIHKRTTNNNPEHILTPLTSPNTFVCFTLNSPSVGFGQMIYMDEILNHNEKILRNKDKKVLPPIVNQPYTPKVKKIEVNYKAKQHIKFTSDDVTLFDFFHKHPLGCKKIGSQNSATILPLLAEEDTKAYLFIGLEQVKKNEALSFYFNLQYLGKVAEKETVNISYLSGTVWKPIPKNHIVQNTTQEFTISGILEIIIPKDIHSNHQWFDKEKEWIRLSTSNHYNIPRECFYLETNVGIATRKLEAETEFVKPIPPKTITELKVGNKNIQQIYQPFPSFGGKDAEKEDEMYGRISHILRHKNRAIRIKDFMNLVLDNFSEVLYLKCLTSSLHRNIVKPGELHLIVVYKVDKNSNHSFSPLEFNEKIKRFLENKCLLGVVLKVYNPDTEEVKVNLNVRVKEGTGFPKESIENKINQYIAPWLYSSDRRKNDFNFNLTITGLIRYVSREPSVIAVDYCQIIHVRNHNKTYSYYDHSSERELIKPELPTSLLVPSKNHHISYVSDSSEEHKDLSIGSMVISEDFIIQSKRKEEYNSIKHNDIEENTPCIKEIKLKNF